MYITIWMNLKGIMLNDKSHSKGFTCMIPFNIFKMKDYRDEDQINGYQRLEMRWNREGEWM